MITSKRFFRYCAITVTFMILIFYLYNDGFIAYKLQKATSSPIQLVEYYTGIKFPDEVEISNVKISWFDESKIMSSDYLEAMLIVPSNMIDKWFPESGRHYNFHENYNILPNSDKEKISFSYNKFNAVRRWGYKTQRTISFAVLESENESTQIYISVDMLGWYLWDKWKLGGMD